MNNLTVTGNVTGSIIGDGTIKDNTINVNTTSDLSDLAKAIQNNGKPDPKKLASLKRELIAFSKQNPPMTLKAKAQNLLKALEAVQDDDSDQSGGKLWDVFKPYIGDGENLSATLDAFGKAGGFLLGILRKIFLPV